MPLLSVAASGLRRLYLGRVTGSGINAPGYPSTDPIGYVVRLRVKAQKAPILGLVHRAAVVGTPAVVPDPVWAAVHRATVMGVEA